MKIVYLAAGAGGMYCGSCLHDNTLVRALLALGEDAMLVPTYTPLRTDEVDVSSRRIFFGGLNVYLQQKSALFRHLPWPLDYLLDRPGLISLATRFGPGVDPARLGDLTVSMLRGEDGLQRKEARKLARWLGTSRPDVVHLSNVMLLGMQQGIGRLGIPLVCTLSGEDIFLEKLVEPFYSQARQLLQARAKGVDAFVALNRYFADYMADYLAVPREKIFVIPHGLDLAGHSMRGPSSGAERTVGYFARVCPDKGLDQLVAAFEILAADTSLPPLRLRAAGYLGTSDRPYLNEIRRRVARWRNPERFEYAGELDRSTKIAFLQSLDVMSLPTVYRESKGISVLEAMANGVPVVLPAHGAFPEIAQETGGGVLHEPGDVGQLAATIKTLLLDDTLRRDLGRRGFEAIHRQFSAADMALRTQALYREVLSGSGRAVPVDGSNQAAARKV